MIYIGSRVLLTLWVGGMWTVGFIVAPTLFAMLADNRMLAGSLAGRLFTTLSYIGLVCGTLLLLAVLVEGGKDWLRQWRVWLLVLMLVIICIGEFVLQPMMAQLREAGLQGDNATAFARLHGVSSTLFLINSIAGLVLVIAGLQVDRIAKSRSD